MKKEAKSRKHYLCWYDENPVKKNENESTEKARGEK